MKFLYPYKNALWALRLCNRGRLLSVRPAPTLFDHLYASLHRAFGHTRPASVPGLSVGLPPSPRLGLRPKPHFQKHIGLSTVCNPPIFVGGFLYFLVIVLSDGKRTVFTDFEQQYLFFLAGIGIYIYEHLSAVRRGAVKFIAIKLVCACGRHYGK